MATNLKKFTVQEALNAAMNDGGDGLKVDISNVTLDGSQLAVELDHANDSVDIALAQDDIVLIKNAVEAMKLTMDKLDPHIDSNDGLKVDTGS